MNQSDLGDDRKLFHAVIGIIQPKTANKISTIHAVDGFKTAACFPDKEQVVPIDVNKIGQKRSRFWFRSPAFYLERNRYLVRMFGRRREVGFD